MSIEKEDSPQLALDSLDPERITFARELRGLTKKELALAIEKTSSAISQIERGVIRPDLETLIRISLKLQVPTTFFMQRQNLSTPIKFDTCHFRSRRSTSQIKRRQSVRIGDLLLDFIELLEKKGVVFPQEEISSFVATGNTFDEINNVATELRKHWGMGLGPIPNIVKLFESKGIIVLPIYESCEEVDAYSTWRGTRPCILLSYGKTASRSRFDVAHELGHLLFHEDIFTGETKWEKQADQFAGAFLAPKESFIKECPRRWNLEAFKKLKFRWKLSIQALLYRAHALGCLSHSSYKKAMMDISRSGIRLNEGPEWESEKPTIKKRHILIQ